MLVGACCGSCRAAQRREGVPAAAAAPQRARRAQITRARARKLRIVTTTGHTGSPAHHEQGGRLRQKNHPYGQPVTYTDSQRVSAAKRRETVRNGCESARISCEIRYETSLNFAKFTRILRKSAKECMGRNRCESICRLAIWAKRPRNARKTPRNSGESYETAANILRNCVSHVAERGSMQDCG